MNGPIFFDHFPVMVLLATLIAAFLALLWRDERRDRVRFFARLWLSIVGCSIALGWLMLLLPPR